MMRLVLPPKGGEPARCASWRCARVARFFSCTESNDTCFSGNAVSMRRFGRGHNNHFTAR